MKLISNDYFHVRECINENPWQKTPKTSLKYKAY